MQANQSPSIDRQRKNPLLAALCLALIGLFMLMGFAASGRDSQKVSEIKLSVEDSRPVVKAIETLEKKYGWVITYEDPRYVHDSEIVDTNLNIRKDLNNYKSGETTKFLAPRGGALEFTYDVASDTNLPVVPAMVVQKMLDAQAARDNGGRFRLETNGQIMHVIPTAIKNSAGALVPQESILDSIISLPSGERTVLQKLESVCAVISRAINIPVELGTVPDHWFQQRRDQQGATNQRARDILGDTFETMGYGTDLSWWLYYSPTFKKYLLHIHFVSKRNG
jgi:hypothetical protein